MKKMLLVVFFLFLPNIVHAQTAGPLDTYVWDYKPTDITTYNVNRFEICVDNTNCRDVATTSIITNPTIPPPPGYNAYGTLVGALTAGSHVISVKACNATGCGGESSSNFNFVIIPPTAINGRFQSSQNENFN